MPNPITYLELPADPAELTRELALQMFEHPEAIYQEFARLAQSHATTPVAPVLVKAAANDA